MAVVITPSISLQDHEIQLEFMRASGPGGQSVNKVNTAVQLRFDIQQSESLDAATKKRLLQIGGHRVTEEGVLLIKAKRFRTQIQNRQDAIERLVGLLKKALLPPKKRKKTKPSLAIQQKRLEQKTQRGKIKKMRSFDPQTEM